MEKVLHGIGCKQKEHNDVRAYSGVIEFMDQERVCNCVQRQEELQKFTFWT